MGNDATDAMPPAPLDYGRAPPRRRKIIRRTLIAISIICAPLVAWRWGPAAWRQIHILYWHRQVMSLASPADMIVYEEDPTRAMKLLTKTGYAPAHLMRVPMSGWGTLPDGTSPTGPTSQPMPTTAAFRPAALDSYLAASGLSTSRTTLVGRTGFLSSPRPSHTAVAFMGELRTPSGQRRLVVVECFREQNSGIRFHAAVFDPGSILKAPSVISPGLVSIGSGPLITRIFAGQTNGDDPSHFIIRYEGPGATSGTLEGKITDQGRISWRLPGRLMELASLLNVG